MQHTQETTIAFRGVLDVRRTAEVREVVYAALSRATGDVHVDLTEVESLDITTLKLLAVANRVAERQGRRVVLQGCSPSVRRFLHFSHLRWMLSVEPDEDHRTSSVG
jgi:anti-anti-sigma factor